MANEFCTETAKTYTVRLTGRGGNTTLIVDKKTGKVTDTSGAKVTNSDIAIVKQYIDVPTKEKVNAWRSRR